MRERPILFSGPMVRAILGTKMQTRRVFHPRGFDLVKLQAWRFVHVLAHAATKVLSCRQPTDTAYAGFLTHETAASASYFKCPYGQPGDRLWVRETFAIEQCVEPGQPLPHNDGRPVKRRPADDHECLEPEWCQAHYSATDPTPALEYIDHDGPHCRWKPSIHMPRWASRILLEITAVRVERLQDISEADALAEGIVQLRDGGYGLPAGEHYHHTDPRQSYLSLWEAINGPGSVEANPWVWCVSFKRCR